MRRSDLFCRQFYERGLMMRSMRHMKLFCQVAGNRMYKKRVEERLQMEVKAEVEKMKNL